jgi:hypothetical protein
MGCGVCAPDGELSDRRSSVRVRVSDPQRLRQLLDYLAFDPTVVVTQLSEDELEVAFVGSLSTTGQAMETELRLRAWLVAHADVIVTMSE